jgi:hypothetical protein
LFLELFVFSSVGVSSNIFMADYSGCNDFCVVVSTSTSFSSSNETFFIGDAKVSALWTFQ